LQRARQSDRGQLMRVRWTCILHHDAVPAATFARLDPVVRG
jgi:hypothetical protein